MGRVFFLCSSRYLPRTTSIPESIRWSLLGDSLPTRSVSRSLSSVSIWDTLATDSFGRPLSRAARETFPGADARRRLLVKGTQTTVAIRLRFRESPCTMTIGLLKPGPDPAGTGRSAHHTSPCEIRSWAAKVSSPLGAFQHATCGLGNKFAFRLPALLAGAIHRFCDLIGCVAG